MKRSCEMGMKQELLTVLTAHLIISSCGSGFSTDKKMRKGISAVKFL